MEKWHPIFHVPDFSKLMVDSTVRLAASAKKASWLKHHSKPTMFVSRCLKFGFLKKELHMYLLYPCTYNNISNMFLYFDNIGGGP